MHVRKGSLPPIAKPILRTCRYSSVHEITHKCSCNSFAYTEMLTHRQVELLKKLMQSRSVTAPKGNYVRRWSNKLEFPWPESTSTFEA